MKKLIYFLYLTVPVMVAYAIFFALLELFGKIYPAIHSYAYLPFILLSLYVIYDTYKELKIKPTSV